MELSLKADPTKRASVDELLATLGQENNQPRRIR